MYVRPGFETAESDRQMADCLDWQKGLKRAGGYDQATSASPRFRRGRMSSYVQRPASACGLWLSIRWGVTGASVEGLFGV
jgi:hypothetical protein